MKSTSKLNALLDASLKPLTNERWTGYQRSIVFMLFLAMAFAYMDRINLSVAMPVLIKEHHIKPSTAGLLLSIFNWSIALSMLVSGPLIDYFRPKKILPLGVGIWSVATWITGLSTNIFPLAFARGLLGVGEAALIPSASRIISEVFKKEDRGKVMGIYFSGTKVGLTLGAPLAGVILVAYGWQAIFYVTAAISAAWLILWLPLYRSHKGIVPSEISGEDVRPQNVTWLSLLTYRSVWALMLGQAGYLYIYFVFITWIPSYLVLERHMSILKTGFLSMIPFIAAVIAALVSGWAADRWIRNGGDISVVRKTFISVGFTLATIFILIAAYTEPIVPSVFFLFLSMAALGMVSPNINALPIDFAPRHIVSSVSSLQNVGGNIGGAMAPIVTGILYGWTGNFQLALVVTGGIALVVGAGTHIFLLGKIRKSIGVGNTGAEIPALHM